MSSHEISHLLSEYGLAAVFLAVGLQALGAPLPGSTVLIAAALVAATSHTLPIEGVIAAAALGVFIGSGAGFAVGRWGGERLLMRIGRRLRQKPERVEVLRHEFANYGGPWIVLGRWVTGVRNVTGLLAGASGMAVNRFIPISAAAALAWSGIESLKYYWFGRALAGADTWLQVVLIVAGLGWTVLSFNLLRKRAVRRLNKSSTELESAV